MLFHHCDFLHFSRDQLSRWIPSLSSNASAAAELFICINEKDFWVLAATAIIIRNFFGLFSLAAAALLSPFSMHEINSLFYTLSLLCIAASEKTSPFPQKKTRHFSFQNFLCFIQWVWFSLDFIRREKIRPICISFFRRLLDKTRRVFCAYVLEKLIYTRVISSS